MLLTLLCDFVLISRVWRREREMCIFITRYVRYARRSFKILMNLVYISMRLTGVKNKAYETLAFLWPPVQKKSLLFQSDVCEYLGLDLFLL